jgi:hypothetical protein
MGENAKRQAGHIPSSLTSMIATSTGLVLNPLSAIPGPPLVAVRGSDTPASCARSNSERAEAEMRWILATVIAALAMTNYLRCWFSKGV